MLFAGLVCIYGETMVLTSTFMSQWFSSIALT